MRKVLVVMQFAVSVALIAGTFIVYSQFTYMQQRDLGYDTRHNLVINAPMVVDSTIQNKMEVFKNELKRNADVNIITATNDIPGKRITWLNGTRRIHEEKGTGAGCYLITADQDFLPTYKIKLLAGRNFTREDRISYGNRDAENVPLHRVIINKTAAKVLGFSDAEEAVNERIIFILGTADRLCEVIGVVEDYHQQSLRRDYEPILFFYPEHYWTMYLTVNIDPRNTQETIAAIQGAIQQFLSQ